MAAQQTAHGQRAAAQPMAGTERWEEALQQPPLMPPMNPPTLPPAHQPHLPPAASNGHKQRGAPLTQPPAKPPPPLGPPPPAPNGGQQGAHPLLSQQGQPPSLPPSFELSPQKLEQQLQRQLEEQFRHAAAQQLQGYPTNGGYPPGRNQPAMAPTRNPRGHVDMDPRAAQYAQPKPAAAQNAGLGEFPMEAWAAWLNGGAQQVASHHCSAR